MWVMGKSQKTNGLWMMQKGEFEQSVSDLERAIVAEGGNPRQLFDLFRTDKDYTKRIARMMLRRGLKSSIAVKIARLVLGRNVFDDADWMSYYDANLSKKLIRAVAEFPWSDELLNSPCPFNTDKLVKDTHFAFFGLPSLNGKALTVLGWHDIHPATGQPKFYFNQDPWYKGEGYANKAVCEARWYLLLKDIVPGSTDKMPEEQEKMLPPEYEIPTTIAEVTKDILCFRKTDVRVNPSRWAHCKEKTSDGFLSCVGHFAACGLYVSIWDGSRYYYIGVGASRKLPS